MTKILYLSCHEILGYDEGLLLTELGHQVFSPGSYVSEDNRGDLNLRPGLPKCDDFDSLMQQWHALGKPGKDNKECLTLDFVKQFDCVILMHLPQWMHVNWPVFKASGVPIIWRTIGQSVAHNEKEMSAHRKQGMKILRYSPIEQKVPGYIGEDACIRFYKDPNEFCNWVGAKKEIITFGQHMQKREPATNFNFFENTTKPFPRKLFGPGSEMLSFGMGKVPYAELKTAMQEYRVYFYTGTWPASYTLNFIEAFMTGIPMVCIGPAKGHPFGWFPNHPLYEIPDIIQHGVNGFYSDNPMELRACINELLNNDLLAKQISDLGRKRAVELFGKETIKNQWQGFLNSL